MKKLFLLLLFPISAWAQTNDGNLKSLQIDPKIRNITSAGGITKGNVSDVLQAVVDSKISRIEANSTSGTNTYTATISWLTGYSFGLNFPIVFNNGNTGASTLNVNTLGAVALKKNGGSALVSGDLAAGQVFWVFYDGSNFQVIGIGGGSPTGYSVGGDLSGTLPNPTVTKINGNTLPSNAVGSLTNDGSGILSWSSTVGGDLSGSLPNPTVTKINGNTLPVNASGALTNNGSGVLTWSPVTPITTWPSIVSTSDILSSKSMLNGFDGDDGTATLSLTDGSTVSWDWKSKPRGNVQWQSGAGATTRTLTITNHIHAATGEIRLQKLNSADLTITFTHSGASPGNFFSSSDNTDYGFGPGNITVHGVVLSGAANTYYTLRFTFEKGASGGLFNAMFVDVNQDYVETLRTISTTSPLVGGGDLSADRTISIADAIADGSTKGAATFTASDFNSSSGNISLDYTNGQAASGSVKGFLTSADWTTFNNKQATGNYITALTGDVTASGPGSVAATIGAGKVTNAMLAGSISDGNLATSYIKADGTRAFTGDQSHGGFKVTNVKEIDITGTAGAGFANLISQSSNPSQPSSSVSIFSNSGNHLSWMTPADVFSRTLTAGTLTANRTYTLRDFSGSFLIDNGTNTLSGATTITSNTANWLNYSSTFTTTANNQYARQSSSTVTLRGTASDTYADNNFITSVSLASTTQNPTNTILDYNVVMTGGLVTGSYFTQLSAPSTLAGMTTNTYTSVSAASTSGSGLGAVFTVVVSNATTITVGNITVTTAGSGYKVNDTFTFNGSQFGSGSGSIVLRITGVTGQTIGNNASPLRIINRLPSTFQGPSWKYIQFEDGDGDVVGGFQGHGGSGGRSLSLYASTGTTVFSTDGASLTVPLPTTFNGNVLISGSLTYNSLLSVNISSVSYGNTSLQAFKSGSTYTSQNSSTTSEFNSNSTINSVGLVNTATLTTGGATYTTGTVSTTGGTGSGCTVNVLTVSGGAVVTFAIVSKGSNYVVGDVLTITGGNGAATITITAVDFGAAFVGFSDTRSLTDAKSNNIYASLLGNRTLNITSTQTGAVYFAYDKSTYTALGSFGKYNIVYEGTGSKGGIGSTSANINSTWDVNGSEGYAITTSTGNLTLDATHRTIVITSGTNTYTLPAASGATRRIYKFVNQTGNVQTISTYKDLSGTSQTTIAANSVLELQTEGSNYYKTN